MTTSEISTTSQKGAVARTSASHSDLAEAQRHLYTALGRALPGREKAWAEETAATLAVVRDAVRRHRQEVQGEHGLYAELRFEAPWLLPRLDQLVDQTRRIETEADHLATQVQRVTEGDVQGIAALRPDAERMLTMLRDLMAKEADLTWERFDQPIALD